VGTWLLVRHGQSIANAEGWLAGHRDVPLTARGRDDAISVRDQLAGVVVDRVVTSDLTRAIDTAAPTCAERALVPTRDRRLRERDVGAHEGRRRADLMEQGIIPWFSSWDARPPGGESLTEIALRMLTALDEHDGDGTILVVSHGGPLRVALGVCDALRSGAPLPAATDLPGPIRNAVVTTRALPYGFWRDAIARIPPA
jgi:broad specificity phosphatase PhoE